MLPASVKFDPTDQELVEHLEAKVTTDIARSHPLIDLFIPTIDREHGIYSPILRNFQVRHQ